MKKLIFTIIVMLVILMIMSGCSSFASAQEKPRKPLYTPPSHPPVKLPSPESLPPEERAVTYTLLNEGDLVRLGMQLPRQLTAQEKDRVIQFGLNTQPVSEKISQGSAYRVEQGWMSYNKVYNATTQWRYHETVGQLTTVNPDIVFFPAVRIGLGTPQQFEVRAAFDLVTNQAVYVIRVPDKHIALPSYVKPLTEQEKATLIAIASETKTAKGLGANPKIDFQWVAISKSGGIISSLNKDIVEKGIPANIPMESEFMTIYPMVTFDYGSWKAKFAVDLKIGKIVHSDSFPMKNTIGAR